MKLSLGIVIIFVVTFLMILLLFVMVEGSLTCSGETIGSLIPECRIKPARMVDFFLGIMLVCMFGLIDIVAVYQVVSHFLPEKITE